MNITRSAMLYDSHCSGTAPIRIGNVNKKKPTKARIYEGIRHGIVTIPAMHTPYIVARSAATSSERLATSLPESRHDKSSSRETFVNRDKTTIFLNFGV